MDNITVLGLCGLVISFGGACTYIAKIVKPIINIKDKVKAHETMLDNDNQEIKELKRANVVTVKSLIALLDHEITGNSVDKLKTAKNELQDYLIERR